jgi:site-specific DNA-methyltransferase (adenine-specific)
MMNNALLSSKNLDWCTPLDFFKELDAEFHFTLDAAASPKSAKCAKYYTPETDGLKSSWGGETVFCNPPYGRLIGDWVRKGYEEGQKPDTTVVMLIPARTDTIYFHDCIYGKAEIRFLKGRLKFTDEDGNVKSAAPFPSLLAIFRGPRGSAGSEGIKDLVYRVLDGQELTANELTEQLRAMGHTYDRSTVSPCLTKLKDAGRIRATGKRTCAKTGKMAVAWTAGTEEV